jgi:hypothetical protein
MPRWATLLAKCYEIVYREYSSLAIGLSIGFLVFLKKLWVNFAADFWNDVRHKWLAGMLKPDFHTIATLGKKKFDELSRLFADSARASLHRPAN